MRYEMKKSSQCETRAGASFLMLTSLKGALDRRVDDIPRSLCPHWAKRAVRGEALTIPHTAFSCHVTANEDFYISHRYFHCKIPLNAPMTHKMKETICILSMFTTPNFLDIQTRIHLYRYSLFILTHTGSNLLFHS